MGPIELHNNQLRSSSTELLSAALRGDRRAQTLLFESERRYLMYLAERLLPFTLRAQYDPADLVQDTLLLGIRKLRTFRGKTVTVFRHWLRRILVHKFRDYQRSSPPLMETFRSQDYPKENSARIPMVRSDEAEPEPSPLNILILEETKLKLEMAWKKLPRDYRKVLALRVSKHCSFDEIGEVMNRSEAAVRKLWTRAVARWKCEVFRVKYE